MLHNISGNVCEDEFYQRYILPLTVGILHILGCLLNSSRTYKWCEGRMIIHVWPILLELWFFWFYTTSGEEKFGVVLNPCYPFHSVLSQVQTISKVAWPVKLQSQWRLLVFFLYHSSWFSEKKCFMGGGFVLFRFFAFFSLFSFLFLLFRYFSHCFFSYFRVSFFFSLLFLLFSFRYFRVFFFSFLILQVPSN